MSVIKIFLASSSELKADRIAFEIFINRKNKELNKHGVFLELVIWEDFIDTVSKTRLQDEYNKAIKECDIFLMLFCTKVGKYTEEEFETAFGQFKKTNKPLIYTYFKDADISTGSINRNILTMLNFKEKLKELGHFVTGYKNIEDLQLQFSDQLTKLADEGFIKLNQSNFIQPQPTKKLPKELNNNIPKTHPSEIVGREKEIEDLHQLLYNDKRVVVVNGLGGIGKTTLAQAYIHKYYDEYNHIAWVTQTTEDISNDFINTDGLLKNLEINTTDTTQLFSEVVRKLKTVEEKPNLLVIDNAEQSLKQYKDILPSQPLWHLLVTSREDIPGFYKKAVGFLNDEQSIELFKKYYTHEMLCDDDIRDLVKTVDHHTLTIEILAKTAEVQRYDINTLKNAIEKELKANVEVSHHSALVEKVSAYLSIVFNMSKLNNDEIWMMKQFACLPSEFLSYNLLYELITGEREAHKNVFAETLHALKQKGWLLHNAETDSYKMHRIITDVTKKQYEINVGEVESLIEAVAEKLSLDHTKDNPVDKFIWVPFGKTIADYFTENNSDKIAQLQNILALRLKDLGDYRGAKELLEKAVASFEKNFGKGHPNTATSYSNLALVLQDLGEYKVAKELLEKVVASVEKNFGKGHPNTATSYSNLATALKNLGEYEGAKELLEKAVAFDEKNFGKDHPTTATSYSNLGLVLKDLGDYKGAKELLEKAVFSDEKNFGKDHPTTATSYSNLGLILKALGVYKRAKELLEQALDSTEKNFGKDHPITVTRYSNLALVLQDLGDYKGAKELLEKAVASAEKNFGKDHPTTAISYSNLASVFKDLGDYKRAKNLLEKAVSSDEKNFGKDNANTATSYSNLALVLQDLGDYKGAKDLLEKAVSSDEKKFGKDHPTTALRYSNLALVLKDLGDYKGAKELLEKAVFSDEKNFGKDHPTTATSYSNLGLVLQDLEDYKGAKDLLEKAVFYDEKNFGKDHPITATRYSNLALVLKDLGDYKGAKELLEKAVMSDEKNFGKDHPTTATSYSNLALVLKDLRDFKNALGLSGNALAILKRVLPPGHPKIQTVQKNYQSIKNKMGTKN